jgi:hypothetical protein
MNLTKKYNLTDLLEVNWVESPFIYKLSLAFLITRIPLLNLGYGKDPDAWRVAISALYLKNYHIYQTSRSPGYPLTEFVNSIVIQYGWVATNSITMLLSLASVIIFGKILDIIKIEKKGLLTVTYAFMPILWINSTNTMDYMWGLTLLLISWYFSLKKRYLLSSIPMGLAISSRINLILFLLPLTYLVWEETRNIKKVIYFNLGAGIISIIMFSPLLIKYGLGFITYVQANFTLISYIEQAGYHVYAGFGPLPIIIFLMGMLISAKKLIVQVLNGNEEIIFLILAIVPTLILYLKAPYEAEYLIPVIPFGLILVGKLYSSRLFSLLCILLLLNSVVSVCFVSIDDNGKPEFKIIDEGAIRKNIDERIHIMQYSEQIRSSKINHSVVVAYYYLPSIRYLNLNSGKNFAKKGDFDIDNDVEYLFSLNKEEFEEFKKEGYTIYYVKRWEREAGYDIKGLGGVPIETRFV